MMTERSTIDYAFEYDPCYHNPRMRKNSFRKLEDVCSSTEEDMMMAESLAEVSLDGSMPESLAELSLDGSMSESLAELSLGGCLDQEVLMDNNMDAPPKRRVRFRVDKADCILSDKSSLRATRISGEEREEMWWSREEMKEIQYHAHSMCKLYLQHKSEFCREIALLLTQCARTDPSEYCLRTNQTANSVALGPTHGISSYLVPMFQRRQKKAVQAVLYAQGAGQCASDEAAHLLSIRYQHWSRYAVTWAQVMADADATVNYQQEEEPVIIIN